MSSDIEVSTDAADAPGLHRLRLNLGHPTTRELDGRRRWRGEGDGDAAIVARSTLPATIFIESSGGCYSAADVGQPLRAAEP
jgi:hypothetical protein